MMTKQVKFKDLEGEIFGGILIDDEYVICGCCGGVFEVDEIEILEQYEHWVDISTEIIGD